MANIHQTVLAIDSAQRGCGVAVMHRDNGVLHEQFEDMQRGQAERLMPMVEEALEQSGLGYEDIDLLAVTVGPGSFTGIRVGLSTAKALALALDKPLVGIGTFDVFERQFQNENPSSEEKLCLCLETKRSDFYVSGHSEDRSAACLTPNALTAVLTGKSGIITGDAAERAADFVTANNLSEWTIDKNNTTIRPSAVAMLALEMPLEKAELPSVEPVYLRGADVSQPKKKKATIVNN